MRKSGKMQPGDTSRRKKRNGCPSSREPGSSLAPSLEHFRIDLYHASDSQFNSPPWIYSATRFIRAVPQSAHRLLQDQCKYQCLQDVPLASSRYRSLVSRKLRGKLKPGRRRGLGDCAGYWKKIGTCTEVLSTRKRRRGSNLVSPTTYLATNYPETHHLAGSIKRQSSQSLP
jgi:hypothetical protein